MSSLGVPPHRRVPPDKGCASEVENGTSPISPRGLRARHASHLRFAAFATLALSAIFSMPSIDRFGIDAITPRTANAAPQAPLVAPTPKPFFVPESILARPGEPHDLFAAGDVVRNVSAWPSGAPGTAKLGDDGRDDTAWVGLTGASHWTYRVQFQRPQHVSLLRARFGVDAGRGVPIAYRWEAAAPIEGVCAPIDADDPADARFVAIDGASDAQANLQPGNIAPQPTARSWFVDVDACALRLSIDGTNGGAPVIRELSAIEGARDVLREATASADRSLDGTSGADVLDGTYERAWIGAPPSGSAGAPSRSHVYTLTIKLAEPAPIDRVHLVLGGDATSAPRLGASDAADPIGRTYGVADAPVRYRLEGSDDGVVFTTLATEPRAKNGAILPVRRRLITFAPRALRALRLTIDGATGGDGRPDPFAAPVVREVSAYRADDARPLLFSPWILSVNANPAGETHESRGGELANDAYWTKFLDLRFSTVLPALRKDDRYARMLGNVGQLVDAKRTPSSGMAIESIEGDDPTLDEELLVASTPRPIVVLSGSNNWDYAKLSGPDRKDKSRWRWDPLRAASARPNGGMGQLQRAVKARVSPFLGFCGGAQILALLEAKSRGDDGGVIDAILRRTTGRPIRGFAPASALERTWPGDGKPRMQVVFAARDPLFRDLVGSGDRTSTQAFPESHADVVRPSAFLPGAPLSRFEVLATSVFCGPDVIDGGPDDRAFPNPSGAGKCARVPEVFRSNDGGYPIIGAQFHAEQYDFPTAAEGDPAESTADARLFIAAEYEAIVDAYLKNPAK